jgi:hypothetical protein
MCLQRVEVAPALKEEESQFVFAIEVYRMLDATILFSRSVNMIEADTAQFADRLASAHGFPDNDQHVSSPRLWRERAAVTQHLIGLADGLVCARNNFARGRPVLQRDRLAPTVFRVH